MKWNDANETIALKWFEAFNEHNPDKLLSLYHPGAMYYNPGLKALQPSASGYVRGRQELHGWWKDAFDQRPSLYYEPLTITASTQRVFMEYTRRVDGDPDMLIAEVLEIKEGLIVASRAYHG